MEIIYTIDTHDFKDYGVRVSSSQGLLGGLKPKIQNKIEWPDEDGFCTDTTRVKFDARDIVLNCFVQGVSSKALVENMNSFCELFYSPGLKILNVSLGEKSLQYNVLLADKIDVVKKFKNGVNVGTFALKLVEPSPTR